MWKLLLKGMVGVLVAAALLYLGDFLVFEVRTARGGGMGSLEMTRVVVAPLKGNKEEYYPDVVTQVDCSKTLFPQAGSGACWWLRRNPTVMER